MAAQQLPALWVPGKQMKNIKHLKSIKSNAIKGYTVLELSVAAAIMVSLTAIATPSVLKFMQDGQVDEAKALMNTAIAECLNKVNQGKNDVDSIDSGEFTPESLPNEKMLPGSYVNKSESVGPNKVTDCRKMTFEDPDPTSRLTTLKAMVDPATGKITKIAVAKHPDSKKGCEQWADPNNCFEGGDIERLRLEEEVFRKKLAAEAAERKRAAEIEQAYKTWLKDVGTGTYNKDGIYKYAFQGIEKIDEAAYKKAQADYYGKVAMDNYIAWLGNPPINTGFYDKEGLKKYVFRGTEVADQTAFNSAKYDYELAEFNSKIQEAKTNKTDGKVTLNGHTKWTYNGNEFANEAEYTAAKPVPVAPVVATPTQVVTQQPARPSCPWPSPWDKYFC